jgi:tetratricopeptide (TPR) repeat protein
MRAARGLLALAFVVVAAAAMIRQPWAQCRCNVEKRAAEAAIDRARARASDVEQQRIASQAIPRLIACARSTPDDWQVHFLLGSLWGLAGKNDRAMESYKTALELERRPEIYFSLSMAQFEHGEPEEGLRNAEQAAMFNIAYADEYDPRLKNTLWQRFGERQQRLTKQPAR